MRLLPEHVIEDVLCLQVQDVEMSVLAARKGAKPGGLEKKTEYLSAAITYRVTDTTLEDGTVQCVPVINFENVDHDPDQGKYQALPVIAQ